MKNKIIVITGATRGIGLALKTRLAKENTVITMSRSEVTDGKTAFKVDVGNRSEVKAAFDEIGKAFGHVDVLINNAGYGLSGATELLPEDEVKRIVNVNYLGVIWCCQCALPYMQAGSKIAMISSASGMCPMPYRAMYNSTKAAVTMLSDSLNCELRHLGIDCTAFILGAINTDFTQNRTAVRDTNSRYGNDVKAVDDFVERNAHKGKMSLDYLVKYIVKKLSLKHQRLHYIVGFRYKLAGTIQKFFPSLTQSITNKTMRK